jgi:pimeloyl-ACP methyl ester carboxylesterase
MSTTAVTASSSAELAFAQSRVARAIGGVLRAASAVSSELATRLALQLFFAPVPSKIGARQRPRSPWRMERVTSGSDRVVLLRHEELAAQHSAARPRVLLVHGWAGNALQMSPLGLALAGAGYEPVLLDFPAHGRSDGWRCTMPQMVRSLFAVQTHVGQFAAIVAHSMGSRACMHAMARGLAAQRLVVLAPSPSPASVLRWFGEAFRLDRRVLEKMRERIEQHGDMVFDEFESLWFGKHLQQPALVIHDRDDRMAALANGELLASVLPNARLLVTEGLSHRRVLSDPRSVAKAVAHLSGLR